MRAGAAAKEGVILTLSLLFGATVWPWVYLVADNLIQGSPPSRGLGLSHRYLFENLAEPYVVLFLLVPYGLIAAVRSVLSALRTASSGQNGEGAGRRGTEAG